MNSTLINSISETTATRALTALDIKALKQADRVCFQSGPHCGASVRCIKATPNDPYQQEREYSIPVLSDVRNFGNSQGPFDCFEMEHTCSVSEQWQTIIALLRVGDILSLLWFRDNNSDVLRDAGMHCDALSLVIRRGKQKFTILYSQRTGPDNSARMTRTRRW